MISWVWYFTCHAPRTSCGHFLVPFPVSPSNSQGIELSCGSWLSVNKATTSVSLLDWGGFWAAEKREGVMACYAPLHWPVVYLRVNFIFRSPGVIGLLDVTIWPSITHLSSSCWKMNLSFTQLPTELSRYAVQIRDWSYRRGVTDATQFFTGLIHYVSATFKSGFPYTTLLQ